MIGIDHQHSKALEVIQRIYLFYASPETLGRSKGNAEQDSQTLQIASTSSDEELLVVRTDQREIEIVEDGFRSTAHELLEMTRKGQFSLSPTNPRRLRRSVQ